MSESKHSILALDEHVANDWFLLTLVTPTDYATVGLKPAKREAVLEALAQGEDPIQTMKSNAPFGQPPRIVPLASIEAIEWYADDTELNVRYFDSNRQKSRGARASISDADCRSRLIDAVSGLVGECETIEEPASIWHVGMGPMIISAIALLVCGTIAVAGYFDPGPVDMNRVRRPKAQALAFLFNAVGPTGMAAIGLAITALCMVWWYLGCQNPPTKSIVKPRRLPN